VGRKSKIKIRKEPTQKVNLWLAELLTALQDKDLNRITIDDIATLAQKSKSTIYEYFESKEDILVAACRTRTTALADLLKTVENVSEDPIDAYQYIVGAFTEAIADISISFLHQIKSYYPRAWSTIDHLTDTFIDLLRVLYDSGVRRGHFRPMSIELLAHLDKYFVTQVVTDSAVFSDSNYTLSLLVNDYLDLRLNGLILK